MTEVSFTTNTNKDSQYKYPEILDTKNIIDVTPHNDITYRVIFLKNSNIYWGLSQEDLFNLLNTFYIDSSSKILICAEIQIKNNKVPLFSYTFSLKDNVVSFSPYSLIIKGFKLDGDGMYVNFNENNKILSREFTQSEGLYYYLSLPLLIKNKLQIK